MKQRYLNKVTARLGIVILLAGAVFIINSCRKESRLNSVLALSDSVNLAKTWYESTYPVITAISGTLATQSVNNGQFDYSQHIKPDWQHAANYNRYNKGVVEIPVDPSAKFATALTANTAGKAYYDKKNSKTSFVLLNDGKNNYNAFIMTIMADDDYLANDTTKLAKNTYHHRDVNFSGMVFYFTPKGKFISSYRYKNGKMVPPSSQVSVATGPRVQSIAVSSPCDVSNSIHANSIKQLHESCQEWYWLYSVNGVVYAQSLAFTICVCDGGDGGQGPPDGTNYCTISTQSQSVKTPHLVVNNVNGEDDGGFPDPSTCSPTVPLANNFGMDTQCLNCRVLDNNFDNLLNFAENSGLTVTDPFNTVLTVNGFQYTGQITEIYDQANNLVASYFSPDLNTGPFLTGVEYSIGNTEQAATTGTASNASASVVVLYGDPSIYLGGGTITYTPPAVLDSESWTGISSVDPDDAWWNDTSLSFPTQILPSFATLYSNFPVDASGNEISGPTVYSNIGGDVYNTYVSSGNPNACALRLSIALSKSGITIPNIAGQTFQGGDGKYYFLSSAKIYNFMVKTFGQPDIKLSESDGGTGGALFESKVAGYKGIFIMKAKSPIQFGAYGHATLYNGLGCVGGLNHCYFSANGGVTLVAIWKTN